MTCFNENLQNIHVPPFIITIFSHIYICVCVCVYTNINKPMFKIERVPKYPGIIIYLEYNHIFHAMTMNYQDRLTPISHDLKI